MLRTSDRRVLTDCYNAVCNGGISEAILRSLLILVRLYGTAGSPLRDMCDLVAHPDQRDQGLAHGRVAHVWGHSALMMGLSFGEVFKDRLPQYAFDIIQYEIKNPVPETKRPKGYNGKRLSQAFRDLYEKGSDGYFYAALGAEHTEVSSQVDVMLGSMHVRPAYSTHQLVQELANVGEKLRVTFDKKSFLAQQPTIELHYLVLLDETRMLLGGKYQSHLELAAAPQGSKSLLVLSKSQFPGHANLEVSFEVVTSELRAADHCTPAALAALMDHSHAREAGVGFFVSEAGELDIA